MDIFTDDGLGIYSFRDTHFFLSNFYPVSIEFEDKVYPTSENAYQATKVSQDNRDQFITHKSGKPVSPGSAKRLGRRVKIRSDWEEIKLEMMETILRIKFRPKSYLAYLLTQTDPLYLCEGNTWKDTYWGVYNGSGENHLGKILMKIRGDLIERDKEVPSEYRNDWETGYF